MLRKNYRYIWYTLVTLKKAGIDWKDIKFKSADNPSPYLEVNTEEINIDIIEENSKRVKIELNPFLRFTSIFGSLLTLHKYKNLIESMTNVVFHFMGNLDLKFGLNKKEYYNKFFIEEIERGIYGEVATDLFTSLSSLEKLKISESLQELYDSQNSFMIYEGALKKIFPKSILYDNQHSQKNLVIYINEEETTENKDKLKCLNKLFLPLGLSIRVFWKYHFGVVGVDKTMKIDAIAIY